MKHFAFMTDIDGTLLNDQIGERNEGLHPLKEWIQAKKHSMFFGLVTGRNQALTQDVMQAYRLPEPDVCICSAGTEIYYGQEMRPDRDWDAYISQDWERDRLETVFNEFPGFVQQPQNAQWPFKLSYYHEQTLQEDDIAAIREQLKTRQLAATLLVTEHKYVDFLPQRASKGQAIRYLSEQWDIPLHQVITSGNSGNDEDMLTGDVRGIVVGNYSSELETLKTGKQIYFARGPLAKGIMEGLHFYGVM